MANCLIAYFSQTGTTTKVAESIATGLRREGYQVDLQDIKEEQQRDVSGYDLLGIGSPVYVFRPPFIVTDYLNNLPDLEGLPTFTFLSHGTYRFDTFKSIQRVLIRKGAKETGYFHCYGADFWLGYLIEGYLFSPDHPTSEELSLAEDFGNQVARNVAGKSYALSEEDRSPNLIFRLERFFVNRLFVEKLYSRMFKVDKTNCSKCGLCIEMCPLDNIGEDKDGYPVWGRKCLLCLTCQMKCPKDAINTPVTWPIFRPFMVYNARHASRDPSLDYVRVTHSKGRTRRI